MTPAAIARLKPAHQRTLAVALLAAAALAVLAIVLGPIVLLHRHYDAAIDDLTDRLERYRRVAAQAPELRHALDIMKEKDGRRFYLKNTAPNLAGAELADLVRSAIENNGGRITTSQNPGPRDEGTFRQLTVNVQFFATTPALAKILQALDTQVPYLIVDNISIRPLNAFRGFKPAPGQEPENNVQLDVSALAYPEPTRAPAPAK
ncbi:MAG TPA: type II secretion system protein GspM [Casimicrobiaceae bacterium]|nr:type II secretion system protein GspM [Casimicrobiaceae bacterium]